MSQHTLQKHQTNRKGYRKMVPVLISWQRSCSTRLVSKIKFYPSLQTSPKIQRKRGSSHNFIHPILEWKKFDEEQHLKQKRGNPPQWQAKHVKIKKESNLSQAKFWSEKCYQIISHSVNIQISCLYHLSHSNHKTCHKLDCWI